MIIPYLCYMRQDKAFHYGESISQAIIGHFLSELCDRLITVDAHLHRVSDLQQVVPVQQAVNLTAAKSVGEFIANKFQDAVLLGPDSESEQWVSAAAAPGSLDYLIASKKRFGDKKVAIEIPSYPLQKKHVVIVDDMASTGETIMESVRLLHLRGVATVSCVVTHALFTDEVLKNMKHTGIEKVWSSNSITHSINAVDICSLLVEGYQQLAHG